MREYNIEIEGKHDLTEINLQIANEEAGASEFVKSQVSIKNNQATNVVTFKELDPGTVLPILKVVKQNDPQPPGTKKIWDGVMVVSTINTAMIAYRTL